MPLLYRGHAAFLFTSRYEAWGLPVMEAMASGLPVVATRCLGLAAFAEHGFNCLLADAQARFQSSCAIPTTPLQLARRWAAVRHMQGRDIQNNSNLKTHMSRLAGIV